MTAHDNANQIDHVSEVLKIVRDILADMVIAVYLYGSAVMAGLRPQSDVDFFVVVQQSLTDHMHRELVAELLKISGAKAIKGPARPIELTIVRRSEVIPWQYPPTREFQYGEWLRAAFESGQLPQPVIDPDMTILIAQVRAYSQALLGPPADALFEAVPVLDIQQAIEDSLPSLLSDLYGDERNVILTLARMWLTLSTGHVVSKDKAASWVLTRLPSEHHQVLDLARRAYLGESDDWSSYTSQVEAFASRVKQEIQALLER